MLHLDLDYTYLELNKVLFEYSCDESLFVSNGSESDRWQVRLILSFKEGTISESGWKKYISSENRFEKVPTSE